MSTFDYRYEDQNIANWINYPNTTTPLNQTNLRAVNSAIQKLFEGLYTESRDKVTNDTFNTKMSQLDATDSTKQDIDGTLTWVKDISYSSATGTFTVTRVNGTTFTVDTKLEKLAVNFVYDGDPTSAHYQNLIITLDDGTIQYVDMSTLVTEYEFEDSSTIDFHATEGSQKEIIVDSETIGNKTENGVSLTFPNNPAHFEVLDDSDPDLPLVVEEDAFYFRLSGTATADTVFPLSKLTDDMTTPGAITITLNGTTQEVQTEGQLVLCAHDGTNMTVLATGNNRLTTHITQAHKNTYRAFYVAIKVTANTTYNNVKQVPFTWNVYDSDGITHTAGIINVPSGTIDIVETVIGGVGITAEVKEHSIGATQLETNYLANITQQATNAANSATRSANSATQSASSATSSANSATDSSDSATLSESWAVGGTNTRTGEDTNNSKYWSDKAQEAYDALGSALVPKGTITFANLPNLADVKQGWMYNISDAFISDARFKDGAGKSYGEGSNVYAIEDSQTSQKYWDVLSPISGPKVTYKTGTLTSGSTTITFTGMPTSGNNVIDFFTSTGINYTAISQSSGSVTLTFDAQSTDVTVTCRIEEVS